MANKLILKLKHAACTLYLVVYRRTVSEIRTDLLVPGELVSGRHISAQHSNACLVMEFLFLFAKTSTSKTQVPYRRMPAMEGTIIIRWT